MISGWHIVMAAAGLISAAASWHEPRARWWIALILIVYAFGCFIVAASIEPLAFIVGASDVLICYLFYLFLKRKWEWYVMLMYLFSVLVSAVVLAGRFDAIFLYAVILDMINYTALIFIGVSAQLRKRCDNDNHVSNYVVDRVFHFAKTLGEKRRGISPFNKTDP